MATVASIAGRGQIEAAENQRGFGQTCKTASECLPGMPCQNHPDGRRRCGCLALSTVRRGCVTSLFAWLALAALNQSAAMTATRAQSTPANPKLVSASTRRSLTTHLAMMVIRVHRMTSVSPVFAPERRVIVRCQTESVCRTLSVPREHAFALLKRRYNEPRSPTSASRVVGTI